MRQEWNLGSIKAHSLGAVEMSEGDIAQQTDVCVERNSVTIDGLGRLVLQFFELAIKRSIVALEPIVFTGNFGIRIDVKHAGIAVDYDSISLMHNVHQALDRDYAGNFERLRQNRRMRRYPAG